jgi:hypothetical protein
LIPSRIFFPIASNDDRVFSDSKTAKVFASEGQQQNGGRGYAFSDHLAIDGSVVKILYCVKLFALLVGQIIINKEWQQ